MLDVLIVDDDSKVYTIMKKAIQWELYDMRVVDYAANGLNAIEYLKETAVDIVFIDIMMPHLGGIDVIKRVHDILPEIVFVVLSSYSDYKLVKDSFCVGAYDYLLKIDVDDEQIVSPLLKRIHDKSVSLKVSAENMFRIADFADEHYSIIFDKSLRVLTLKLISQQYMLKLVERLRQLDDEVLYRKNSDWITIIFYMRENNNDNKAADNGINKILDIVAEYISCIGISEIGDIKNVKTLYNQSLSALAYQFYSNEKIFFFFSNTNENAFNDKADLYKRNVMKYILNGDYQTAYSEINDLLSEAKKQYICKDILTDALHQHFIAIYDAVPTAIDIGRNAADMLNSMSEIISYELLCSTALQTIEALLAAISEKSGKNVYYQIKQYLEKNYSNPDLSLECVSEQLRVNKRSICKYLIDNSNLQFKAYLNEIRINEAKKRLVHTNEQIQEIAYQVGYNSIEHFSRIFSQKTGISPSQYAAIEKARNFTK